MSNKKIRSLLFYILIFFAGFIVHALFFPTIFTGNIGLSLKHSLENKTIPVVNNSTKGLTQVLYEDGQFDPQVALVEKSYYVSIINASSTELMTLTSDNPLIQTTRGYGKSEELRVQLYETGTYAVSSTLHPDQVLKVIVR